MGSDTRCSEAMHLVKSVVGEYHIYSAELLPVKPMHPQELTLDGLEDMP